MSNYSKTWLRKVQLFEKKVIRNPEFWHNQKNWCGEKHYLQTCYFNTAEKKEICTFSGLHLPSFTHFKNCLAPADFIWVNQVTNFLICWRRHLLNALGMVDGFENVITSDLLLLLLLTVESRGQVRGVLRSWLVFWKCLWSDPPPRGKTSPNAWV